MIVQFIQKLKIGKCQAITKGVYKKRSRRHFIAQSVLVLLLLFGWEVDAQVDATKDWFTAENLFDETSIRENKVQYIEIWMQDKKDNEAFKKEQKIGSYQFDQQGRLLKSQKFISLRRRIDTATLAFFFDENGGYKKVEKQGAFHFSYSKKWVNDSTWLEIKVDEKTLDTNYSHRIVIRKKGQKKVQLTKYNNINRPMQVMWQQWDESNQHLIYQRESYTRSLTFVADSFTYESGNLVKWLHWNTIGTQSKMVKKFHYINNQLDFVEETLDGKLVYKYAFLYNKDQLVESMVVRNMGEKSIRIYRFFYDRSR